MSNSRCDACCPQRRRFWLLAAFCVAGLPSCASPPEPQPRSLANPAANNHLDGLSLTASLSGTTFELKYPPDRAELTVTLWNANTAPARVAGLPVIQGDSHSGQCREGPGPYTINDLGDCIGLVYLLRFANGAVVEVGYPSPRFGNGLCFCGGELVYGPIEVPAGGTKSYTQSLHQVMNHFFAQPNLTLQRCKSFSLTVVAEKAGLRSNTVFVNGEFALPPGFDPIAELRALRQAKEAALEAERARYEAEEQRLLRKIGAVPP